MFRALQFGWLTTPLVMDEEDDILRAIEGVPGIDAREIVGALDDPEVDAAYEADRADARTAEGSPTALPGQGRADRRPRPLHRPVAHLHRSATGASRRAASSRSRPTT